jgi:hypothetical protein
LQRWPNEIFPQPERTERRKKPSPYKKAKRDPVRDKQQHERDEEAAE